jgi:hypothetical protein
MFEDENCGVWNSIRELVRGNHQRLLLEGSFVATKEITQVISFVDATVDHVHRGVYCMLAGGAQRRVHEEHDDDPPQGPEYTGEAVEWESAWVWTLGADLATWLGIPHTDREGRPTNTRALAVRARILAFAHDLLSQPGPAECALGSYDGEDLSLRYDSDGGTVSLRITGSYGSRERVMKRGALPEITRYLRHFITPRRLLAGARGGF